MAISKKRVFGLIWRQEKPCGRTAKAMSKGSVSKGWSVKEPYLIYLCDFKPHHATHRAGLLPSGKFVIQIKILHHGMMIGRDGQEACPRKWGAMWYSSK